MTLNLTKTRSILAALGLTFLIPLSANATVVEIRTSLGNIQVNLFDETTPETVANFLSYVNSGAYASNVVHRSVSNFVIQGGGFTYTAPIDVNSFSLDSIPTGTPIANDPKLSNVRGTISMAKTSNPDSATSQWFINLSNNSNSLDVDSNSGGFTVFGQVVDDGMQVVDAISALSRLNVGGAFSELPIQNYTQTDFDNDVLITSANLVFISDVVITDSAVDTAANLNPVVNSLNTPIFVGGEPISAGSGGGGSFGWLLMVLGLGILHKRQIFLSSTVLANT